MLKRPPFASANERSWLRSMIAWLVLVAVAVLAERGNAQTPPSGATDTTRTWYSIVEGSQRLKHERFLQQLAAVTVSMDFVEAPLGELVAYLQRSYHVPIQLDEQALEGQFSESAEMPVTVKVRDVSLRSALDFTLAPLGLYVAIENEMLMITTHEQAVEVRMYPVPDLVPTAPSAEGGHLPGKSADKLIEAIVDTVDPDTWETVGGPGTIRVYGRTLAVNQTDITHARVVGFLTALRQAEGE